MSNELYWLCATLFLTAFMAFPYVLNRIAVRGLLGAMRTPSDDDKPLHTWALRAQCAHSNAVENLVIFAPAVLIVEFVQANAVITTNACVMYFLARLLHYIVYTLGIPVIRTVLFFAGWGATIILLVALLGGVS